MYGTEIARAAGTHGLNPSIVGALIAVESSGNPWAWNPEPAYRYFWNVRTQKPFRKLTAAEHTAEFPPLDFPTIGGDSDQEWWGQQASWGLMQVMGAVAREHGFVGTFLPELCDVKVNLEYGCRHLARLLKWARGDMERALAAYNGGTAGNLTRPLRNSAYAAKVMARVSVSA